MVEIRDKRYGKIKNVPDKYASMLVKLGKHELVTKDTPRPAVKEVVKAPEPFPAPPFAFRGEGSEMPTYTAKVVKAEADDDAEKTKRKYTRRDMSADE